MQTKHNIYVNIYGGKTASSREKDEKVSLLIGSRNATKQL